MFTAICVVCVLSLALNVVQALHNVELDYRLRLMRGQKTTRNPSATPEIAAADLARAIKNSSIRPGTST